MPKSNSGAPEGVAVDVALGATSTVDGVGRGTCVPGRCAEPRGATDTTAGGGDADTAGLDATGADERADGDPGTEETSGRDEGSLVASPEGEGARA